MRPSKARDPDTIPVAEALDRMGLIEQMLSKIPRLRFHPLDLVEGRSRVTKIK